MIATVVDEDDGVRDSLCALQESYGHEVNAYPSAEDFLRQAKGNADFLVVHHHMPGMTGLELIERLQTEGDRTPALLITARKDAEMARHAERIGVKLLEKPAMAQPLLSWIEDLQSRQTPKGDALGRISP